MDPVSRRVDRSRSRMLLARSHLAWRELASHVCRRSGAELCLKEKRWLLCHGTEDSHHRLMPPVLTIGFLPVLIERHQRRCIVHREEHGALFRRCVVVFVPGPAGDDEHISLLPGKTHLVDDGLASPLKDVVDGAADMAMRPGMYFGSQHLNPAG